MPGTSYKYYKTNDISVSYRITWDAPDIRPNFLLKILLSSKLWNKKKEIWFHKFIFLTSTEEFGFL
jgi:hypothetical protein